MGLDMYLSAKLYSSDYFTPEVRDTILPHISNPPYRHPAALSSLEITLPVMYWRKANAIHNWFVTHVQNGFDECQETDVSLDQLKELRDLCADLLKDKNPAQAAERLPPTAGFFFGSTEIDDGYWRDLQDTVDALTPVQPAGWSFTYRSSW